MSAPLAEDYLHVEQRVEDVAVVLRAVGEVDVHTAPLFAERLAQAATTTSLDRVVVDLREVRFFGSKGISALVVAHQQCRTRGIALRVVAGPAITRRLDRVGLLDVLAVCPTLAEAFSR